MHLDCVFNIVGDDLVVLVDSVAGEHTGVFRLVDEYTMPGSLLLLSRREKFLLCMARIFKIPQEKPLGLFLGRLGLNFGVFFSSSMSAENYAIFIRQPRISGPGVALYGGEMDR